MKIDLKKKSKRGKLAWRDFFHGLISTVIGAVLTSVVDGATAGHVDVKTVGIGAGIAGLSFLGTQLGKGEKSSK